jgi:hypothetical protein
LLSFGFSNYKTSAIPVHSTFENEKDKFVVTDPLYITEPLTGSAVVEVTKEGDLTVFDSSNKKLQTISLAKYKLKTAPERASIIGETTSNDKSTPIMMKAISIGLGFALIGAFVGMWKKRIMKG